MFILFYKKRLWGASNGVETRLEDVPTLLGRIGYSSRASDQRTVP